MDLPILLTSVCYLTHNDFSGVNPPDGRRGPNDNRRTSALHPIAGAFFAPAVRVMAAVRGTPSGVPVPIGRSANPRTAVSTFVAGSADGSSLTIGIDAMTPLLRLKSALNPSAISRAKAHRAMALAALRSNSSLQNRLKRYNAHTEKARQLESLGGAQS